MNSYNNLKLSLTKFGYHKVSTLLKLHDPEDIFEHLDDEGEQIDYVQASKILSSYYHNKDENWKFWRDVKQLGQQDINDVVFFSIVLSHSRLTNLVIESFKKYNGIIHRDNSHITDKEYTNFARTAFELGFIVDEKLQRGNDRVTLDISRINYKFYLPSVVMELIRIKLMDAEAPKNVNVKGEILSGELHYIFNMSSSEFSDWLSGTLDTTSHREANRTLRDYDEGINFKIGHIPKLEGVTKGSKVPKKYTSTLTHNRLQTKIFEALSNDFPNDEIGTEVPCNTGSIDIVRKNSNSFVLYELKTSGSIQSCVREAFGQLMEYAYFGEKIKVDHLVIISANAATSEVKKYFKLLRDRFNLPIYYQYFDELESKLSILY